MTTEVARMSFWRDRPVLVTGANGFIGAWLTDALLHAGAQVVAIVRDHKPSGGLSLLGLESKAVVVHGNVTDATLLGRAFRQYHVTHCFHLAAQALVEAARSSPVDTFESNIAGTWTVLEACRQAGVEVVVASSDKAYGPSATLPYLESMPLLPTHPYDASKACADLLARSFYRAYGLPVAVTRCANIYGAGDLHPSRLIPDVILSILAGRAPVLRSDGSLRRDLLYVDDAVAGYLRLGERLTQPGVTGEAFNFGAGHPHRVRDVVQRILHLMGRPELQPTIENRVKPGEEIPAQYVDSARAGRLLGWRAETTLDEGLRRTIEWYRQYVGERAEAFVLEPAAHR
jgi:CDP-glucose 4,6-dehydratase